LTRNPSYHGRFPGNLEAVEVKLNLDNPAALARYEANGADTVYLGMETYPARQRYVDEYISYNRPTTLFVSFDINQAPLDDLRVREAFVLAVDRDRLVGEVLGGRYHPASGGLVPPGMPGHSPGIGLPYDPEKARQLLAQAGYPSAQGFPMIQLELWRKFEMAAEYLSDQWRQNLGVEVEIDSLGWLEYLKKKHSTDLVFRAWGADYLDPDNFLRVCVQYYIPSWRNEPYRRLLENASRSTHQKERMRLYQAADKILIEEAAIMPLKYGRWHGLVKPWVKVSNSYGTDYYKYVILEPH
jgi:ABC-type oligopeptide transport system substrate-binding subunit